MSWPATSAYLALQMAMARAVSRSVANLKPPPAAAASAALEGWLGGAGSEWQSDQFAAEFLMSLEVTQANGITCNKKIQHTFGVAEAAALRR